MSTDGRKIQFAQLKCYEEEEEEEEEVFIQP